MLFTLTPRIGRPHRLVSAALVAPALISFAVEGSFRPELLALFGAALLMLMCAAAAPDSREEGAANLPASALLAAALVSASLGLLQYFGLEAGPAGWVQPSEAGQAFANLRQRNQLATLTVLGMVSLAYLCRHGLASRLRMMGAAGATGWLAIGNAATTSRTGLAQLLVMGAVVLWWQRHRPARPAIWLGATLATYLAAASVLPRLLAQWSGREVDSIFFRLGAELGCHSRKVLWSDVLDLIALKPWRGWGWGELDYAHYSNALGAERFCDILDNAHNLPLQLAVEQGIPAAVIACALLAIGLWRASRLPGNVTRRFGWLVLLVVAIHSLVEYPLWYGPFQMVTGLGLGLVSTQALHERTRLMRGCIAAGVAGAVALAWVDYQRVTQAYLPAPQRWAEYRQDPLNQVGQSFLFGSQLAFARLTLMDLTPSNAAEVHRLAQGLIHYSPEPRVIEKLIESATLLGMHDEARRNKASYKAAFPKEYIDWTARSPSRHAPALTD